ncbi:MAG: ABC transporter ATP-binding protein [Dehalococcoidia bacterium]
MADSGQQADGCAIEVERLVKSYGDFNALRGVDLKVKWGEGLAIFGPNGAGKTTLIKILSTIAKASSGRVSVGGFDLQGDSVKARRQIGVVTHQTLLYDELSTYENLRFYGKMYDVPHLADRIRELVAQVDLEARRDDPVRTLSRGMQQRAAIARALLHDPPILLLDEPGTGLDQRANEMLINIVSSTGNGRRTVIMTTHSLEQGLAFCNRVLILARGNIVYEESGKLDISTLREVYHRHTGVGY